MPTNNNKNAKEKGQTGIASFFLTTKEKKKIDLSANASGAANDNDNKKKNSDINKEDESEKENSMGLDSNLRKSAVQKSKEFGTKPTKLVKKNPQRTIDGGTAEGRCDEGTKVCRACEKLKTNPKFKSFAHHPTCPKNSKYKQTNGGRTSNVQYFLDKAEAERMKALNKPLSGNELFTSGHTQEDVDEFFIPRSKNSSPPSDSNVSSDCILSYYNTPKLIERITYHVKNPNYSMQKSSSVPMVVAAGIQTLLDLIPLRFRKGTNQVNASDKRTITYAKLQAYRKKFPPGTIGFTFPRSDKSKPPDHYYCQLEGRTIYFLCWELNVPGGWEPTCFKCGHVMIHDQYDFQQHGYATPVFDISGTTDYACSMYYNCSSSTCKNRCKGNDGRIYFNMEPHFRNAYPVDPRYAVGKETHLTKRFTRVMDKMMITHGNGDQLAAMLHELRGDEYLDREEEYFSQAIAAGIKVTAALPSFSYFIGRHSPTGSDLRDRKDSAGESSLVSTGVSDKDRFRREMQGVGCPTTAASDHTFEFKKNYVSGLLSDTACGHTIGSDTGEIASLVIVQDTKQTEYAHQAEQVSLRPNWKPKVHTTDNCPSGIALWKTIIHGVHCQLGLFHYMYRITKTLNKECTSWRVALAALQTCMYYYEGKDLENVKGCLEVGTLGKVNGVKCPPEQIEARARTYRENIRIWTWDSGTIYSRLAGWLDKYKDCCDEKGEYLFTMHTSKTVIEQMRKAKWVVDRLSKDELYLEVEAPARSRTGLNTYIGKRGAESKLEKGHHAIAHFANGGMRHTLADFLGMGGIAQYNLRIRYRLRLAKMKADDRAKVPVGFQKAPHFTNHLRLSHHNKLAQKAGIDNVHSNVEILQPDNGERFFYEGFLQQRKREKDGIQYDDVNRCLCRDCGRKNPYRKRQQEWETQDDLDPQPSIIPAPTQAPPPLMLAPSLPPLLPLPTALLMPPPPPPQQHHHAIPTAVNTTSVGPYSAILASTKKKKKRYKSMKKVD